MANAQLALDAGVQFGDEMTKAGDISIFRFTIKVPAEGDLIRTFFPESVQFTGTGAQVDYCKDKSLFL